jgi:stage V sporulation protein R
MASLGKELWEIQQRIQQVAREYGLDFFETIFEVVDYKKMNEVAAYGGFPTRYPHWRFGMEYEQLAKSYEYGLSKIYEMVINNDPAYAYLLEGNNLVDQKTVIAHVYAHVDFFKNNYYFSKTNRKMADEMANHGTRVRRYMDRIGIERVEEFIDTCLSLDNLIDYYGPFIERRHKEEPEEEVGPAAREVPKFAAKDYMEDFINPAPYLEAQRKKMEEEAKQKRRFPTSPQRDVMGFLLEHAPLAPWEADVLSIIREEAYYFAPQGQTKILNEGWACISPKSLVFTDLGLIEMGELTRDILGRHVADGAGGGEVYDKHVIDDIEMRVVRTRRGLVLRGSHNHRVRMADGVSWRRLDELAVGDRVEVAGGQGMWPHDYVQVTWLPATPIDVGRVASLAGVGRDVVYRVMHKEFGWSLETTRQDYKVMCTLRQLYSPLSESEHKLVLPGRKKQIRLPAVVDEEIGSILGYLVGDGHISLVKRHLGLTSGDWEQIQAFVRLMRSHFDVDVVVKRDKGRWRALVHAEALAEFLTQWVGLTHGPSAQKKQVPACIRRSPASVVRAFIRALMDCNGHAGKQGVILSTSSELMGEQVQLLLLNDGILSQRRLQKNGCWHVHIVGKSAARYAEVIGFGLKRKQDALRAYVDKLRRFKEERWEDEVTSVEVTRGEVHDISVRGTHRYAAAGFMNHNSFWHSRILTTRVLEDSEIIDFADVNSRVLATSPGQLNPYKLGLELLRDIEERWNTGRFGKEWEEEESLERRASWNKELGLGKQKLFEVRRLYNDITFIDEFLTEDFARRNKMFSYIFNKKSQRWEIESREFKKIKQRLLDQLTNFGQPFIYVKDGNFKNRAELLLHHKFHGIELRNDYARGVLEALFRVWKRPVNIETMVDNKGVLMSFDGKDHSEKSVTYEPI